jgi:hypothetical protein
MAPRTVGRQQLADRRQRTEFPHRPLWLLPATRSVSTAPSFWPWIFELYRQHILQSNFMVVTGELQHVESAVLVVGWWWQESKTIPNRWERGRASRASSTKRPRVTEKKIAKRMLLSRRTRDREKSARK